MRSIRPVLSLLALFFLGAALPTFGQFAPGGSAIVTASTPLLVNGRPGGTVEAGQSVTILGVRQSQQQAVISFANSAGTKIVGIVSAAALTPIDGASPAPAAAPVAPAPAGTPAAPELDLTKTLAACDLGAYAKANHTTIRGTLAGKRIRITGVIERLGIESIDGGAGDRAILTLATTSSTPRIKVTLSNAIGDNYFLQRYAGYLPGWWWGYSTRYLDLRLNGPNEIQGRAVYRDGASRYGSSSAWFSLFHIGDPISVEGTFRGVSLDVELDGGLLFADR